MVLTSQFQHLQLKQRSNRYHMICGIDNGHDVNGINFRQTKLIL